MSLINDALKRARKSQRENPPTGAPLLPPVQPPQSGGIGWFLPMVAVALIAAAAFLIGLAFARHKPLASAPIEASMKQQAKPGSAVAPAVSNALIPPTVAQPVAVAAQPVSPGLKLQGIVYDPKQPWAIVNGKTVHVGGLVDGFRVKTISKYAVTLTTADGTEISIGLGR